MPFRGRRSSPTRVHPFLRSLVVEGVDAERARDGAGVEGEGFASRSGGSSKRPSGRIRSRRAGQTGITGSRADIRSGGSVLTRFSFLIRSESERQGYTANMSGAIIAILGVGVALTGLILTSVRGLRQDMQAQIGGLRAEIAQLRERMAHLGGLLEGLREAISGRAAPR